jgi:hypothetical protein
MTDNSESSFVLHLARRVKASEISLNQAREILGLRLRKRRFCRELACRIGFHFLNRQAEHSVTEQKGDRAKRNNNTIPTYSKH